jgi:16S rRNA (cytosine1402-N4)-methyltransferase
VAGAPHKPVLVNEAIDLLRCRPGDRVVDCTGGGGGHARRILAGLAGEGDLLVLDRDPEAVERGRRQTAFRTGPVQWRHADYRDLPALLDELEWERVDAILADLGLSSLQLDDPDRGFSIRHDGPLDMRFDRGAGPTAASIVNEADAAEIARILRNYGEEPQARRLARHIIREREREPIRTTAHLARVVESAIPASRRRIHPATRTFQALRIAVNGELDGLDRFLSAAAERLAPGGRIVVIAFHSLEDRIVKRSFAAMAPHCICPPRLPVCRCGEPGILRPLTRRVVRPGADECDRNPRARSARLRAAERIDAP